VVAPLLLEGLLPLVMPGDAAHVDPGVVAGTLLGSQLAPLFAALVVHEKWPAMSAAARPFVGHVARWLAVGTGVLVLVVYGGLLVHIRPIGLAAMLLLLASSLVAGWWAGRPDPSVARASALATSLRNVGAALAIAGGSFAGTPAASAVIAYFFVEVLGSLAVASRWRLPEVHS